MTEQPNVVFLFPDQLRAQALSLYGNSAYVENQIETPNINRLADRGVTLNNAISNCPVCTPARAMLVTGRYPQSTGHLINSTRLGFDYWRAYNQHMVYFNGFVHKDDWNYERWEGYETEGLLDYAFEFMDESKNDPFLMFLSPHQPHYTPERFAPDRFYEMVPEELTLPDNVPASMLKAALEMYRHYLAMILAIDEMLGRLMDYLERQGLIDNTILVFASDHGTQGGSQGVNPWSKKNPYDASIHIPGIISYPEKIEPGTRNNTLLSMVDFFPTLCGLAGVPVPQTVEGTNLASRILIEEKPGAAEPDSVFLMNFSKYFDWFQNGAEWRGVRTRSHMYCKRLSGEEELYDLRADPLQGNNIVSTNHNQVEKMRGLLKMHQRTRADKLVPCTDWQGWLDEQRRVVKNAKGELSHPETPPDWSLL